MVNNGRRSTMASVLDLAFDEAELEQRKRYDDHHQNDRLRGGAAQVQPLLPILVDLENEDHRRLHRTPVGGGVDDRERVEKRVDQVDHEQEKHGWREQWQYDRPEAPPRARTVDGSGFDQRAGYGL